MASYAPNSTTGEDVTDISLLNARSPNRYHLARIMRKTNMRNHSEILDTLLDDSTPASTATSLISQITAEANTSDNVQGGVRTVAAQERMDATINNQPSSANANTARAVTSTDVTAIKSEMQGGARSKRAPSSYPTDASGNGGGGKGEGV